MMTSVVVVHRRRRHRRRRCCCLFSFEVILEKMPISIHLVTRPFGYPTISVHCHCVTCMT